MVGALWTGISGLSGAQRALDNESNNIANVNTLGYKQSRIAFADQMYQDDIGKGVSTFDVEKLYTQGNLKVTGVSYDMALSGDGFFQVSNGKDFFYSRAGNFRMGENGELQNAAGYMVQGWAMASLQPNEDVKSTDENVTKFTSSYSKLLGNAIFKNSTDITTKVTKATDYTETAVADSVTIFTGAGQKTASTKISDVEMLVSEYNYQLTLYNNSDPKPASTESKIQKDLLDYNLDSVSLATGDEMYVYIDGTKYSQSFSETEEETFKLLVDKISNVSGLNAYMTDGDIANDYQVDTQDETGKLIIEGLIPGKQFSVTEFGWTDASSANQATKGTVESIQGAVQGTGLTAIKNIEEAMAKAISGKQKDVFVPEDLFTLGTDGNIIGSHDFKYSIMVYDKEKKSNIYIPNDGTNLNSAVPLEITGLVADADTPSDAIDAIVAKINTNTTATNELADYVKAYNINGNLVIKTLDSNNDVEFTGKMIGPPKPEVQTIAVTLDGTANQEIQDVTLAAGVATGPVTFLGTVVSGTTAGDDQDAVATAIVTNKSDIIDAWNLSNPTKEIEDISAAGAVLTITFKTSEGDLAVGTLAASTSSGIDFGASAANTDGGTTGAVTFLGTAVPGTAANDNIEDVVDAIIADKTNIINTWNTANPDREITTILKDNAGQLRIYYKTTEGDVTEMPQAASAGIDFALATEVQKGTGLEAEVARNATYSGRDGASAEFLSMTTMINQAATKSDIQLRLDTLELTDSAFGDFSVDATGLITMKQDGADFAVGQVAIAKFTDNRGLEAVGNNLLQSTNRSGQAIFNMDNEKTAEVKAGTLELSTSDLSESLVNLMVFQRAFEANSKSITTSDQILTTLIQMKR